MPCRLRKDEIVTLQVLFEHGSTPSAIARELGVVEGTVRYHLRRAAAGAADGRAGKPFRAAALAGVIDTWYQCQREERRLGNVLELHEFLAREHGYLGSYQSVRRFVRHRYQVPKIRPYRRVETVPGAQSQTDWGEFPRVRIANETTHLHAFDMVLSHSRFHATVWSRKEDMPSWLDCHNQSYRRLGGIAAVNRIDNPKTAIARGAGA
jgi:transposase